MEWYWWVLIIALVVAGGALKLKILSKWMESRQKREQKMMQQDE